LPAQALLQLLEEIALDEGEEGADRVSMCCKLLLPNAACNMLLGVAKCCASVAEPLLLVAAAAVAPLS